MATQHTDEPKLNITMSDLKDMMAALVAEMKKPHVDPDIVARNEATKVRMRAQREESERDLEAIQNSCSHLREDNSSRIAWQEQFIRATKLYVIDGFCQNCNKHFHPNMKNPSEYAKWLKIPTGKVGLIY